MLEVLKRDGRTLPFNKEKIQNAIKKAFCEVDGYITEYAAIKAINISEYIEKIAEERTLTIEEIQDLVENGLMATKRKDVARAYIAYRNERTRIRNRDSAITKVIREKLAASAVENQNANVDEYSFGGRRGEADGVIMKDIALNDLLSELARSAHINNEIYTHDLDSYAVGMHNCLSIPFDHLLAEGFNTRQADIRPANSVNTAFQLIAVIFQLQSLQQFGGVSATHLDWTMVPYVRKSFFKHWRDGEKFIGKNKNADDLHFDKDMSIDDKYYKEDERVYNYALEMTERECQQAAEGMFHNLNTLQSRSGN